MVVLQINRLENIVGEWKGDLALQFLLLVILKYTYLADDFKHNQTRLDN